MSDTNHLNIAFIGLGVMGFPMAGHLAKAGYSVTVYNRTGATAERWLDTFRDAAPSPVSAAPSPAEAARDADIVLMCVGNDEDVRSVSGGEDGVLSTLRSGALLIDHTTASAQLARELAALAAQNNVSFLDAPVSGGQAGAENGALTVMLGGTQAGYERAVPVLDAYAKKHVLMGPAGAGQLTKVVNQICIAGVLQGLAEGVHFAQQAQLDVDQVIDVISQGAAQSWQMENRGRTMARDEFDFGFAVDWMRKDLAIALDSGRELGARLPLTALVDQFYGDVQQLGGGRWDTSSLLRRLSDFTQHST